MRIVACVSLLVAGLGAVGCTAPGKKPAPGGGAAGSGSAAGAGTAGALKDEVPAAPPAAAPISGALLAGQVKDTFDRIATKATILVSETRTGGGAAPAPFRVQANEQGFFIIPGLDRGKEYQLTAQIKDGSRVVAEGKVIAHPPDPTLLIRVSADLVTPVTTPIPDNSPYPGDGPKPEKKDERPAATIGSPLTPRKDASAAPGEAPIRTPHRELIGGRDGPAVPGIRPPVPAEIKGPGVPPPPARADDPLPAVPQAVPEARAPAATPEVAPLTERRTPIPWCKRVGKRFDFGLYDLDGKPWELGRNRKGRLVLLDFWHTQCPPCRAAIRHLNGLQREFGAAGLEVVGIAYETGAPEERAREVREVQKQTGKIQYTILMGGHRDAPSSCPVHAQFEVGAHPTLFLLDEDGNVVRQFVGLSPLQLRDLTREIEDRLGLRLR